jgi:hypothetical protein
MKGDDNMEEQALAALSALSKSSLLSELNALNSQWSTGGNGEYKDRLEIEYYNRIENECKENQ